MSVVFEIGPSVLPSIAQQYQRTEKSLKEDVHSLKDWMKTQAHLPEVLDEKSLQNFFILNKCSVEKTKQSIDMYYSLRTKIPEIYNWMDPSLPEMKTTMASVFWVALPKLTKEMYRVSYFKINSNVHLLDPHLVSAFGYLLQEIRLKEDVMFGDVSIFDLKGISLSYATKLTPACLAKIFTIYEKVFSIPLKGVYFLNSPPFINSALGVIKTLIKPKLFERIFVCPDTSILQERFSKDMIPKDYGGDAESLQHLNSLATLKVQQYQQHFAHLKKLQVDEKLRPRQLENDEILGFYGNFKKLCVD